MPRLERLSETQRQGLLAYPCQDHDTAPWTPLARPLGQARVALVTTAGLHVRGDAPFSGGEQDYRVLPVDTPRRDIVLSHTSIGFDRWDAQRDLNVMFPLDRVNELVAVGEVGSLAPTGYAFLGAQRQLDGIVDESAPAVARRLKAESVDAVFLTGV